MIRELTRSCEIKNIEFIRRNPSAKKDIVQALYIAIETGLWTLEGISPPWRAEGAQSSA